MRSQSNVVAKTARQLVNEGPHGAILGGFVVLALESEGFRDARGARGDARRADR